MTNEDERELESRARRLQAGTPRSRTRPIDALHQSPAPDLLRLAAAEEAKLQLRDRIASSRSDHAGIIA